MSTVKRDAEAHQDRLDAIEGMAIDLGALVRDEQTEEISSAEDEGADKHVYAAAFAAWRDGELTGTAQDIFDAAGEVLTPDASGRNA
ncbi:MAG: hypothetical protein ACLQJR_34640 [Stellaceae bacterium]